MQLSLQLSKLQGTTSYFDENVGRVGVKSDTVRLGHGKCLRLLTRWLGGVKKGLKHAYVIFEWSLIRR